MNRYILGSVVLVLSLVSLVPARAVGASPGVAPVPQGTQPDAAYAASYAGYGVTNVAPTTQQVSCYTPEVPYFATLPNDGYTGMSPCNGAATTGEDLGPYPTQLGSNPGYPASSPMLVKDHAESDVRVDPTNPSHVIGSSKWFVSAEGYNHLLGFYESFDGGHTWPVQGHIPGYEGWTDNTDPVGAFDGYGNYYALMLPYQFFYNADGSHNYQINPNREPNPGVPAEVISIAVRPHGATTANDWIAIHNGHPDYIATYDSVGREPDKQWITIDTHPTLPNGQPNPNYNTIYAMWTLFDGHSSQPYVSTAKALPDGTHTDWSPPLRLPTVQSTAGNTFLLPQVAPDGTIYTPITNFPAAHSSCCATIAVIFSTDGGQTWQGPDVVVQNVQIPPAMYANTTFRDGIEDTFAVSSQLSGQGHYPLYVSWEDYSAGVTNVLLAASYDGGQTWSSPIQVNDNQVAVDEFQPNLTVAADGTVSDAFYDRRLPCPAQGDPGASGAGLALDTANPHYSGSLPPYGASNYCVNASVQFYTNTLQPIGQNIRLTQHTWDPQLNSPYPYGINNEVTFIGDYFGNTTDGSTNLSTFVSTYDDGSNPQHDQQQIVAMVDVP